MSPSDGSPSGGSDHLGDDTVRRFRGRSLGPDELIAASSHLQSCTFCRSRLESRMTSDAAARSLRHQMASPDGGGAHLDLESVLMPYLDHSLDPAERESADRHLAECSVCRGELEDLAEFQSSRSGGSAASVAAFGQHASENVRRRERTRWLLAAAAVAACVVGVMFLWRPPSTTTAPHGGSARRTPSANLPLIAAVHDAKRIVGIDASGQLHGTTVSGPSALLIAAALRNPDLAIPPEALALIPGGSQLRGETPSKSRVSVVEPVGVVITSTRPQFRWRSTLPHATYRVGVFDSDSHPVARGTERGDSWQIDTPLMTGRTYVWQVSTVVDGNEIVAPAPDEPEARFTVMRPEVAAAIAAARARGEGHLVVGVLLHAGGALDEARREFQLLANENPDSALARRLLESTLRR